MGSACCGGEKAASGKQETNTEVFREEQQHKRKHPQFKSVTFDVVVPNTSPSASMRTGGPMPGGRGTFTAGASFAAFDQTMYTMRGDASLSTGERPLNNTFNFDTNMSFTNNFSDVNKDVVNMFLRNVKSIAESGGAGNNMLEQSVIMGSAGSPRDAAGGGPKLVGAGPNKMSPEDLEYINDGPTTKEKLYRLAEVEEVLRQNIYGSWSMDSTLIQLAMMRVVPTLRERRRTWKRQKAGAEGDGAGGTPPPTAAAKEKPAKKPVLVVHARGLQLEQSFQAADDDASPEQAVLNSPSHLDESVSRTTPQPHGVAPPAASAGGGKERLNCSMSRSGLGPTNAKVEQYEMLALTCRNIGVDDKVGTKVIHDTWDFLSDDANTDALNQGECLFRFMCGPVKDFDQETLDTMSLFINVSSFADEEKENNTPKIDVHDPEEAAKYICISVKAMYMLPGVQLSSITPALVSSKEYQKACQPSGNKLEDCDVESSFRLTIVAIRFILSFVVMFRVSEVTDPNILFSFKSADGIVPAKAIMLERTKRNVSKTDATAKVRSMLLYYPVNGGLLCNSHTFVLNTSLPKAVAKIVNTFGSSGAAQSAETAKLTRSYMVKTFGDSRQK